MNKIQILLCNLAEKMPSSFVQQIIARLGSRSPILFVKVQSYCIKIASASGTCVALLQEGIIPQFPHYQTISICLGAISAICLGIGGGAALTTTNPNLASPELKANLEKEKGSF